MPVHQVEAVDERFLSSLGIHRIEIPVPFIEAGGPANVYVIENDDRTFTLFDTGIHTVEGRAALRIGLSLAGVEVRQISRVLISHGHIDHYGNAAMLSEESGAPVFIHPADAEKICGHGSWATTLQEHWAELLTLGLPAERLQGLYERTRSSGTPPPQVPRDRVRPLMPGTMLHFRHFDAEVLHLPGHTPGLVCLYDRAHRLFFADDHVLARVSPNPLLDFSLGTGATKFRALSRYLEGARFVHDLELDCVLPGHGPAFRGHRELLAGLFAFYRERQEKLRTRLQQGPASVFALVPVIFPHVSEARLYLTLSEVLGNLEVMEDEGRVRRERVAGVDVFSVC